MHRAASRRAFTLIELLVVVAIITVLIAILLPSLGKAREMSRRSVCGANLKAMGQAAAVYAGQYGDQLPQIAGGGLTSPTVTPGGQLYWFWDVSVGTSDSLLESAISATTNARADSVRRIFFCPSNTTQNDNLAWYANSTPASGAYRVLGYLWMGQRLGSNSNMPTLNPSPRTSPPLGYQKKNSIAQFASTTELALDAILNSDSTTGSWSDTKGGIIVSTGTNIHHTTSHLKGALPDGGNVLYMDGHVDYKKWKGLAAATSVSVSGLNGTHPTFWFPNP